MVWWFCPQFPIIYESLAKVDLIPGVELSRAPLPIPLMSTGHWGPELHLSVPEDRGMSHKHFLPRLNLKLAFLGSPGGPHWPLETPRTAQLLNPDVLASCESICSCCLTGFTSQASSPTEPQPREQPHLLGT